MYVPVSQNFGKRIFIKTRKILVSRQAGSDLIKKFDQIGSIKDRIKNISAIDPFQKIA
jgi:hypothetical protein